MRSKAETSICSFIPIFRKIPILQIAVELFRTFIIGAQWNQMSAQYEPCWVVSGVLFAQGQQNILTHALAITVLMTSTWMR